MWKCGCGYQNTHARTVCYRCQEPPKEQGFANSPVKGGGKPRPHPLSPARCGTQSPSQGSPNIASPFSLAGSPGPGRSPLGVREVAASEPSQLPAGHSFVPVGQHTVTNTIKGRNSHGNEDRLMVTGTPECQIVGVIDGHDGAGAADYVNEHLRTRLMGIRPSTATIEKKLTTAFLETDTELLRQRVRGGACTCAALITSELLAVANVGDTRAVICGKDGKSSLMHKLHAPTLPEERARIEAWGSFVSPQGRVMGILAVSRAFGDVSFKKSPEEFDDAAGTLPTSYIRDPTRAKARHTVHLATSPSQVLVTCVPEVVVHPLTRNDDFVLVSSDGLFNSMSEDAAAKFIAKRLRQARDDGRGVDTTLLNHISKELCQEAASLRGGLPADDTTVAIAMLPSPPK